MEWKLVDPKHSDLAQQIRSFRQTHPQSSSSHRSNKSDSAKDAQIARFKERVRHLEAQVRSLKRRERTALRQTDRSVISLGFLLPVAYREESNVHFPR